MNRSVRCAALLFTLAAGLLCLAAAPEKQQDKAPKVTIDELKYDPAKLTVKVGQTVTWTNQDDHDHTVVSKNAPKELAFESENLGRGDTFKHTFKQAGKFEYFCRYHPRMKGLVIVVE